MSARSWPPSTIMSATAAVVLCGFLAIVMYWQWQQRDMLLVQTQRELGDHAAGIRERIARGLDAVDLALIAASPLVQAPIEDSATRSAVANVMARLPQIRTLWSADAGGAVVQHAAGGPSDASTPEVRAIIGDHRDSGQIVRLRSPSRGAESGTGAVRMSRTVVDRAGNFRAVIVADLDPGFLVASSAPHHRANATLALIDRAGGLVAGTTDASAWSRLGRVLQAQMPEGGDGTVSTDGIVAVVAAVPAFGLRVVAMASTDPLLARWRVDVMRNGLIALAAAGLGILLVAYVSRAERASRLARSELQASEYRLRDAIDAMSDGIVIWDAQDRVVMCNRAFSDHTIRPGDFEPGRTFVDVLERRRDLGIHDGGAGNFDAFVKKRLAERRQPGGQSLEYQRINGRWTLYRTLHMADGCIVSVYTDISAMKEAEQRAVRAEARLHKAIDTMADAWLLWSADDRLVMYNAAFATETMHPAHTSLGMSFRDFMLPRIAHGSFGEGIGREEQYLQDLLAQRRSPAGRTVEYARADGRLYLWRSWPTDDGGVIDVFTDITELKRAEARASRAELRLLDAFDATSDGWHIWDADDRLVLANRAAPTVVPNAEDFPLGVAFADALRARVRRGRFPEAAGREEAFVEAWVARRERRQPYTVDIPGADGRWLHLRQYPTREGGMADVMTDVTEARQWEEKLRAARDGAERANRAKSDFLSNMSHELRTPLNAVLGFSQLLLFEPGGDPLTAGQREAVHSIERTGRHLLHLVEDILDLSRIENSTIELASEALAADELCAQVVELMRPAAAMAGVELILLGERPDLPYVSGDGKRVLQVVTNLVSNAIKYGVGGERIEIGAEFASNDVRFLVRDYGPGIPPDRQSELFRPFSRAGQERTNIEGTGIGLSIAKGLVERMGGRIGVDSRPEGGTTFWFTLPTHAKGGDVSTPTEPTRPADGARGLDQVGAATVLYIEDTLENLALMRRLLARYPNITYLEAESAELGLEIARREKPDIILMDMRLPGMSGIEALRAVRADPAIAGTAVIGLTGAAMPHEAEEIGAAGFDGYITKPFRIANLLATLAATLSRRAGASPPTATA